MEDPFQLLLQSPYQTAILKRNNTKSSFVHNAGSLVGYMDPSVYMEANGTNNNFDGGWQSSYLAGEPSQVYIYDKWDDFSDFVIASR